MNKKERQDIEQQIKENEKDIQRLRVKQTITQELIKSLRVMISKASELGVEEEEEIRNAEEEKQIMIKELKETEEELVQKKEARKELLRQLGTKEKEQNEDYKKIEKENDNYGKDKKAFENVSKAEDKIERLEEELQQMTWEKENSQIQELRLKQLKEKALKKQDKEEVKRLEEEEKQAHKEVEKAHKEINQIKEKIKKIRDAITKSKDKVDAHMKELMKDPEFATQINSILEKKVSRKIKMKEKSKAQTDLWIKLCTEHPSIEMNLKGMIKAKETQARLRKDIEDLEEQIKICKKEGKGKEDRDTLELRKAIIERDIGILEGKNTKNRQSIIAFCEKNKIDIDIDYLDELTQKKFEHRYKKDIDGNIIESEVQVLKTLKRISKGQTKEIETYKKVYKDLSGKTWQQIAKTGEKETTGTVPNREADEERTEYKAWELGKKFNAWRERRNVEKEESKENEQETQSSSKTTSSNEKDTNLPDKKYKIWEVRKKLNAWLERRRVKREESKKTKESGQETQASSKTTSSKFRDIYKYKIVEDYINDQMDEKYKEVSKKMKDERKAKESEEKGDEIGE